MAVGVEHPVVADYLRRLDEAAEPLPPGRRTELVAEIRGHVAEALAAAGRDDEATVRGVLDRLGDPADIVAAEQDGESAGRQPSGAPSAPPGYSGFPGSPGQFPAGQLPAGQPSAGQLSAGQPSAGSRSTGLWGPLEITAVLGLTVGTFVLPGIGPIIGLVCAWLSDRWTRREKIIATIWTVLAAVLVVLLGALLFVANSSSTVILGERTSVPAPVSAGELLPTP